MYEVFKLYQLCISFKKACSDKKSYSKMVLENAICQFLNSLRSQYCRRLLKRA